MSRGIAKPADGHETEEAVCHRALRGHQGQDAPEDGADAGDPDEPEQQAQQEPVICAPPNGRQSRRRTPSV